MRVLFLDVDGVLNSHGRGGPMALSKNCLRHLKRVVPNHGSLMSELSVMSVLVTWYGLFANIMTPCSNCMSRHRAV